jgi:hypothetical protein
MAELGVRPGPDGIRALQTRLAKLEADGFGENVDAVAIREILADPERHLTAKAAKAVDELRDLQIERAALDPELPEATELMSRLASQAEHLGRQARPQRRASSCVTSTRSRRRRASRGWRTWRVTWCAPSRRTGRRSRRSWPAASKCRQRGPSATCRPPSGALPWLGLR